VDYEKEKLNDIKGLGGTPGFSPTHVTCGYQGATPKNVSVLKLDCSG